LSEAWLIEIYVGAIIIYAVTALTFWQYRKNVYVYILIFGVIVHTYYLLSCQIFTFGYFVPIFKEFDQKYLYFYTASLCILYTTNGILHGAKISSDKMRYVQFEQDAVRKKVTLKNYLISACVTILILISIVLALIDVEFHDLLYRNETFVSVSDVNMSIIDILFWPISLLIPIIKMRHYRYLLLTLYFLFFFGLGERQAFLLLVLYAIVRKLLYRQGNLKFITIIVTSMIALSLLIYVRYGGRSAGIFGALLYLKDTGEIFDFILLSFNYLTNFSIFTNGNAIEKFSDDPWLVLYSINPLPSFFINSGEYSGSFDLQPHVPYAGIAMVYNSFGFLGTYISGLLIGGLISLGSVFAGRRGLPSVLSLALAFAPLIFMMQYNLRAGFRFFYYLLIMGTFVFFLRRIKLVVKTK